MTAPYGTTGWEGTGFDAGSLGDMPGRPSTDAPACQDAHADGVHCRGPVVVMYCDQHAEELVHLLHERGKQRAAISTPTDEEEPQ